MAKNKNVKKANTETEFTPEQAMELIRCKRDPIYFIQNYVRVQHPVKGSIPFKLYRYQKRLIRAYQQNRYNIVLSARQTGKSITSAMFLLWLAAFYEDKNILIASNKNTGAMEMIRRIRYAYENLPMWLKPGVMDDGWNKHTIAFDNNSIINSTATSADSGRGQSISLLYLDEFAFVAPGIQEEFWTSIAPTLATGGSCIISSTPNGDSNLFAQIWRAAEVGAKSGEVEHDMTFVPSYIAWDEPPGRDEKFKRREINKIGELKWKQEYECEFLSSDPLLIDSMVLTFLTEKINGLQTEVQNDFTFWEKIKPGTTYVVGVDPSGGTGNDFSAIEVFEFPSLKQIAEYRSNTMSSPELYRKTKWLISAMEDRGCTCYFSVENNGVGDGFISLYMNDENPLYYSEFISETDGNKMGMNTNVKTKLKACVNLKQMVESNKIEIRSPILLKELKNFVKKKGSYEAQPGSTDDCISSCLIITRILEEISAYEDAAFDKLYSFEEDTTQYNEEDPNDQPLPMIF